MNSSSYTTVLPLIALVVSTVFTALPSHGQTDPAAKSLLDKVRKTYEAYKTIKADFSLTVKQAKQVTYSESGQMEMDRQTGKYYITTSSQDIISDGKTQWMVLKDVGEIQVTDVPSSSDAISPANIFSFYKEGYKYVSAANEHANGKQLAVVELTPKDVNAPYFKIRLRVDEQTYQIQDVTIFDKSGNRFEYVFKNTKANRQLTAGHFVFKHSDYPDMEMVDLR